MSLLARRFRREPTEKRDPFEEIGFKDGFPDFHRFPNFSRVFYSSKEGGDSFRENIHLISIQVITFCDQFEGQIIE